MHVITYLNNKSTLYTFHGLNKQTCIFFLQPILQSNHLKKKKDYEMYILASITKAISRFGMVSENVLYIHAYVSYYFKTVQETLIFAIT